MDPKRRELVDHVLRVQASIRTCEGCGQCCTEAFNSVAILPVEAVRIAGHMKTWPSDKRAAFGERLEAAVSRWRLSTTGKNRNYTCPFLEADMSCALPFDVKPTACLAFNPVTPDACEMDPKRFDAAHAPQASRNAEAGFPERRVAIPVAVLAALDGKIPQKGAGPVASESGTTRRAPATSKPVALPRLLSKWGVCSRKEAEARVKDGRVAVDGRVVRDVLHLVTPSTCKITLDGKAVSDGGGSGVHVWFAVNKPRGVVTTTKDPEGRRTVVDLFGDAPPQGVMPVGRLDADSAGLLLMTSDHAAADRLLDPGSHVEKAYRVKIRGALDTAAARRLLTETIDDDGWRLGPFASLEPISTGPKSSWWLVGLREGKNRQIRRRFAREGCEVEVLVRTRFGAVALGDLAPGEIRPLTSAEVKALLGSSSPRPR